MKESSTTTHLLLTCFVHIALADQPCDFNAQVCNDNSPVCVDLFAMDAEGQPSANCFSASHQALASQCRWSCHTCCHEPAHSCHDLSDSPIPCSTSECRAEWADVMADFCPGTCGLCDTGECKDERPNCDGMKVLCDDLIYESHMRKECARTCGFCSAAPLPEENVVCKDTSNECSSWVKNGFCTNTFYSEDLRKEKCRKSCSLC